MTCMGTAGTLRDCKHLSSNHWQSRFLRTTVLMRAYSCQQRMCRRVIRMHQCAQRQRTGFREGAAVVSSPLSCSHFRKACQRCGSI